MDRSNLKRHCQKTILYGFATVLLMILTPACERSQSSDTNLWSDSLSFDPGFPVTGSLTGVYRSSDTTNSKEYVYFAEAVTWKKLLFYSTQGTLLETVPLEVGLDSIGQIGGLSVIDFDTIVLSSVYSNKLCTLDRKGRCRNVIDLSDQLVRSNGLAYELWHSSTTPFIVGRIACFEAALVGESVEHYNGPKAPAGDETYKYFWLSQNSPRLIAFDLIPGQQKPQIRWGPVTTTTDTVTAISATLEVGNYASLNGLCFQFSMYSPVVRILDPAGMKPVKQFEVNSAICPTFCSPVVISKDKEIDLQDSINDRLRSGGTIQSIRYDQRTKRYLVILLQQNKVPNNESKDVQKFAYSVLEYDSAYQFVRERSFTDGAHALPLMLNLSSGTYVLRQENKQEKVRGHHVFDKLNIDDN